MNTKIIKLYFIVLLLSITAIQSLGYTQTNLQALNKQIVELEERLADAKKRQEKAFSIQTKLEEQEKKLANLAASDKYRIQIIKIRADITNIHTKIEAIIKEKNDLDENLRLANNLQEILRETQTVARPETKTLSNSTQRTPSVQPQSMATVKPFVKTETAAVNPKESWRIENVLLSRHFNENERNQITKFFSSGRQINQDDLLKSAYQIYNHMGISLNFIVKPKNGNTADLEILLDQREDNNSNSYFTYNTPMTFSQFKIERFSVTIAK
ncbi:MAG: hypothetical protein P9E24_01650 [Candidatus Competibacter sp.]|nr:hypothetical protein [Candidatus Competibacter sp.]MDG4585712.1 hypothetical protein [Candidatus Competibacter sp.]